MNVNPNTENLMQAFTAMEKSRQLLIRIQSAIAGKVVVSPVADAVERAQAELEDCLARKALGEASDADEAICRSALKDAEKAFDRDSKQAATANAEIGGLSRRLKSAESELSELQKRYDDAEIAWLVEELMQADIAYVRAADEVIRFHGRVFMCADALQRRSALINHSISLAAPLELPTIGPHSAKIYSERRNTPHGIGQLLFGEYGRRHAPGRNEIDMQIEALRGQVPSVLQRIGSKLTLRQG